VHQQKPGFNLQGMFGAVDGYVYRFVHLE
jgi:hypothetical protein